jgi:hypothetical protein
MNYKDIKWKWIIFVIPIIFILYTAISADENTNQSITILNPKAHPTLGGNWTIYFNATGSGILEINDHSFPEEVGFVGLYRKEGITWIPVSVKIDDDLIQAHWSYPEGKAVFKVKTIGKHMLEFKFGNIAYAENQVITIIQYATRYTDTPDLDGVADVSALHYSDGITVNTSNNLDRGVTWIVVADYDNETVPSDSTIDVVNVTFEWDTDGSLTDEAGSWAKLYIGDNETGAPVWYLLEEWNDTNLAPSAFTTYYYTTLANDTPIKDIINTPAKASNMSMNFTAHEAENEDNNVDVLIDRLYVSVNYIQLTYDFWNLTDYATGAVIEDGTELTRSDRVNASAHWNVTGDLDTALVEHNGTGTFVNYTISKPYTNNWTNYTLDLSNTSEFPKAGLINVTTIYANDSYGNWNHTSPAHWFYLWSNASVNESIAKPSLIYNGTSTTLYCKIVDSYSFYPIEGYNVSFYNSTGDYLNSSLTNASGWANITYTDTTQDPPPTGLTYNVTCNITNQPSLFYNVSLDNSGNITIQAVNLDVNAGVSFTSVNFGENVTLIANVTGNATTINRVWANITYYNLSKIDDEAEVINLTLNRSLSALRHEYVASYNPKRSGRYNVTIKAETDTRNATNTTNFDVNFGRPVIEFTYPNYRIFNNQSLNVTVNVSIVDGDLWRANFTLNISNHAKLNITLSESWTREDYNLTNGTTTVVNWSAESKAEGYLRIALNVTAQNGTTNESSIPVSVVLPYLNLTPTTLNISDTASIRTSVIGNVTPINHVNLTVKKQYSTAIERSNASFVFVEDEEVCSGVVTGAGNVALEANGGTTTCNVGLCASPNSPPIDGNTGTGWIGDEVGAWLNVTFNTTYAIDRLEFYWEWAVAPVNVSVYYEKDGDWALLLQNITPPQDPGLRVYSELTPFETDKIMLNLSSAGAAVQLYEVRAYTVDRRESKCYVYDYNYTNTTLSGNYTVNTSVMTGNVTKNSASFFANFGKPLIIIDVVSALIEGQNKTYGATITASGGDLRNVTVNLTIANETVLNITAGDNPQNISVIFAGQSRTLNWTVNGSTVGITNTTIEINSTTGEGAYNSTNKTVEVFLNDFEAPVINTFWFEYKGVRTNKTNLRTAYTIFANITDNRAVESAKANITYPDNTSLNASMALYSGTDKDGIWNFTFENAGVFLNQTDKYEIRISAQDIKYNETLGATVNNFTVYANYSLNATTNYSAHNRGEGITIQVWDVNNNPVEDLNWTVNLTKYNQNETTVYNNTNTTYTYLINGSDPVGNYTLFANVSKLGNGGNNTWEFNVSTSLDIQILNPPANKVYSRSTQIDNPRVKVYNLRNTSLGTANVTIDCLNASLTPDTFNLSFGACFVGAYSFPCDEVKCYSPNSYDTAFNITINATDNYNNTGAENLSLRTESQPSAPSGGGGGRGEGETIIEVAPPTCGTTSEEKELLFQSSENFELVRGLSDTSPIKVTNPCPNSTLENVTLSVEGYSAQYIKLTPDKVNRIVYKETKEFEVFVAAPIYMKKGTYPLDFTVTAKVVYYNYPSTISKITGEVLSYKDYSIELIETRTVPIFVHEISKEEAIVALSQAEEDRKDMQKAGYPATRISKLLDEAKKALEQGDYERTKELGEQIGGIKQAAFITYDLIEDLRGKIKQAEEERGLKVIETKNIFNLALAAFEREDYATARQRIKDAQLVYSLETKGKVNIVKLILDYWWAVSLGIAFTSVTGVMSYQRFTVRMIARKLESLYVEEANIMDLVKEAQKGYYKEKTMSPTTYNETMDQYEKRLAEIQGTRAKLRAKRVGMVKISDELENLRRENENIAALIKKAKYSYFKERSMNPSTYQKSMEQYRLMKAEIEGNLAMLEAKLAAEKR